MLANKNDLPGAVGVDDLIKEMRLGDINGRVVSVSTSPFSWLYLGGSLSRSLERAPFSPPHSLTGMASQLTAPLPVLLNEQQDKT